MKKFKPIFSLIMVFIFLISQITFSYAATQANVEVQPAADTQTSAYMGNELPKSYVDHSNDGLASYLKSASLQPLATAATTTNKKVDLVFVIDSTGSMASYIANVKNNIAAFAQYLNNKGITLRIGVVEFKDITCDGLNSTVVHTVNYSVWENISEYINTLTNITVSGGGDIPETPIDALGNLVDNNTMQWSSDAYKFAVLLTDASYKTDNQHGITSLAEITDELASRQINTSVITSTYDYSLYSGLTTQTNGILADISSDFTTVLQGLADKVMRVTEKPKKAIYVLPGYMGSKLYTADGNEIWINTTALTDDIKKYTVPTGDTSILLQDADGTGTQVHVDRSRDLYGAQDTYKDLMTRLQSEYSDNYNVVFFPYNWLGDLNDSAKLLEDDINSKGYESVILITHSTGGLLASTYISSSRQNKLKVEKAIMLAPPLFGTYTALSPLEYGKTSDLDSMLEDNSIENILGLVYPTVHNWVKGVTKNSPTTYQLLPSQEYLRVLPQIYTDDFPNPVVTMDQYYSVLNGSNNINPNLTNGNNRSHKYLRDNVFSGNVIKNLQQVDTTLVGSSYGYPTPAIANYTSKLFGGTKISDIIYKMDGDGTVLNVSSAATKDLGVNVLKYKDFRNLSHGDLANKSEVLDYVCNVIDGVSTMSPRLVATDAEPTGMSTLVKLNVKADACVDIKLVDSASNVVASVINGEPTGFSGNNLVYTSLSSEENVTNSIIYMPNNGLKVIFSYGESEAVPVNLSVDVSTLDSDGYKTSSATYSSAQTGTNGEILSLDMGMTVDKSNIGSLEQGKSVPTQVYHDQWKIEDSKILNKVGDTDIIGLSGDDINSGDVTPANLNWSSSDPDIVSVSASGVIEAKNYGTAYIYAIAKDGSNKVSFCKVTVPQNATSLSIDDIHIVVGEKVLIEPTFNPSNVTETSMTYTYDTSKGIIDIDQYDVITALSTGTIEVNGTAPGGAETKFTVTVDNNGPVAVQDVKVDPINKTIGINDELTLTATINPPDATNQAVNWFVDKDSAVSMVKSEGNTCIIKGEKAGIANITVVTVDGGYKAIATINVAEATYQLTLSASTGGTITTDASGNYASGNVVNIAAAPNEGYKFVNWTSVNGGTFGDANSAATTFIMPDNATVLTANFEPLNTKPVLNEIGDKTTDEGNMLEFTVSGTDADGDKLVFSASGLPDGALFDQTKGLFSWTPDFTQSGTYKITFTVSDGKLSDSKEITITVNNVTAQEYIQDMISIIKGMKLKKETELLLDKELENASEYLDKNNPKMALQNVKVFMEHVKTSRGHAISADNSTILLDNAAKLSQIIINDYPEVRDQEKLDKLLEIINAIKDKNGLPDSDFFKNCDKLKKIISNDTN